jgi:LL-diaminopimelate aminotransferase
MLALREAAADYYRARWGVEVDPAREVLALIGSKEGIAHFPVAFVDPGDVVLVPDPGYPVYAVGTRFAGGEVVTMPLRRARGFLPDLGAIPAEVASRAKVIWVNYPNNPTAALAPLAFYEELIAWAREHRVIVASDLAYADVYFDDTYNMTGWRVGFAVGSAELVGGLGKVKTNVDSGVFEAVQQAAIAALRGDQGGVARLRGVYKERRDVLCGGLAAAGFDVLEPEATFYCLVANPRGLTSMEFAARLLAEAHIVATPATGFGAAGEGYVRLTICAPKERLAEAVERMRRLAP